MDTSWGTAVTTNTTANSSGIWLSGHSQPQRTPERTTIPQQFYDAFEDEELL